MRVLSHIFCIYSVAYIAGEFGNHLKKQFEAEIKYKKLSEKDPRAVSEEEVLCLQIAGLCHDLGIIIARRGRAPCCTQLAFSTT